MSKTYKSKCKRAGCKNGAYFHGYCKNHFAEAYGIRWEDYLQNRAFKGEKPHLVAARVKGPSTAKPFPPASVDGVIETTMPDNFSAAVIFPEDLWKRVSEIAQKEYRTVEQQCFYLLSLAVGTDGKPEAISFELTDTALKSRILDLIRTDPGIREAIRDL